jgi:hypothetical protein
MGSTVVQGPVGCPSEHSRTKEKITSCWVMSRDDGQLCNRSGHGTRDGSV